MLRLCPDIHRASVSICLRTTEWRRFFADGSEAGLRTDLWAKKSDMSRAAFSVTMACLFYADFNMDANGVTATFSMSTPDEPFLSIARCFGVNPGDLKALYESVKNSNYTVSGAFF